MALNIGVVAFPGSNCDRETAQALRRNGMVPVAVDWRSDTKTLASCQAFVLVGGFSYEDRLRAGAIAAMQPLLDDLYQIYQSKRTPILGICNGAQILLERGWVPGVGSGQLVLTHNQPIDSQGTPLPSQFINDWVWVMPQSCQSSQVFTNQCSPGKPLRLAVAHAQGRFVASDPLIAAWKTMTLPNWQYVDAEGKAQSHAPINPNGSINQYAAVSNMAGDILAMMPHPERSADGDVVFQSLRHALTHSLAPMEVPSVTLPDTAIEPFSLFVHQQGERLVALNIEDNTASSLQLALVQRGLTVNVKRYRYWQTDQISLWPQIEATGLLCEPHKAYWLEKASLPEGTCGYLVCEKSDYLAAYQQKHLVQAYGLAGLSSLRTAELYLFSSEEPVMLDRLNTLIQSTALIHQPLIQQCYVF